MSLLVSLCMGFLTFGFSTPASAGSATGSGHDKEAILADLKSNVPSGAAITGSSCDKIGMPSGGDFAYRCTIDWEWSTWSFKNFGLQMFCADLTVFIWMVSFDDWFYYQKSQFLRHVSVYFSTGTVTAGSPLVRNRSLEVCVRCRQIGSLPVAVRVLLHCDGLKAHRRLGWWGALSSAIHWCMQPRQAQLKKLILRCRLLSWLGWSCFHPDCFAALLLKWHQFDGF